MDIKSKTPALDALTSGNLLLLSQWIGTAENIKETPLGAKGQLQALEPFETLVRGAILRMALLAGISPDELTKTAQANVTPAANANQKAASHAPSNHLAEFGSGVDSAKPATHKRKFRRWY